MGKTIAFIPVRGGSTSIPMKNIKPLCGKPLLYWVASAANDCKSIDEVVVSTDSPAIAKAAETLGLNKVRTVGRSASTATNTASTESAMLEFAQSHDFDAMALVQATSPLLTTPDLDAGFDLFNKDGVDSVLSVVEDKRFYWELNAGEQSGRIAHPSNYDVYNRPRRQDFPGCYMENGAFYISRRDDILRSGNRVSGNIALSVMPADTAFEIDEPEDWPIIDALKRRQLARGQSIDFGTVKMLLTDCDGCLTDAGMYYSESGEELKKFNTKDGMAFQQLQRDGIATGIITGENSEAARRRAAKIRADYVRIGCSDKLAAAKEICEAEHVALAEVAYIGDDLNDIDLLQAVGFPCCPNDACSEVLACASYVSDRKGGDGVIRDVAERILQAGRKDRK